MKNQKSGKRLCEVSVDNYRALGNGRMAAEIMNNLAETGVPMYGVQFGSNSVSFITEEDQCDKLFQIAQSTSTMLGPLKSFSVKKDLGLVVVDKSKLPKSTDSFLYLTGALSDCGVRIFGVDVREKENLIMVAYDDVERAQRILEQICGVNCGVNV